MRRQLRDLKQVAALGITLLVLMVILSTCNGVTRLPLIQAEARRLDADTQAREAEWMLQEQLRTERQAASTAAFNAAVGKVVASIAAAVRVLAGAVAIALTVGSVGITVVLVRANWRRLPDGVSIIQTARGPVAFDTRSWAAHALDGSDTAPSLTQAQAIALVRQRALPQAWQALPRRAQWELVSGLEVPALEG